MESHRWRSDVCEQRAQYLQQHQHPNSIHSVQFWFSVSKSTGLITLPWISMDLRQTCSLCYPAVVNVRLIHGGFQWSSFESEARDLKFRSSVVRTNHASANTAENELNCGTCNPWRTLFLVFCITAMEWIVMYIAYLPSLFTPGFRWWNSHQEVILVQLKWDVSFWC